MPGAGQIAVNRSEASAIARREILARGIGTGVRATLMVDELAFRKPVLRGGPDLRTCWIVYAARPLTGLRSSVIVLVERETGRVVYAGSANDER